MKYAWGASMCLLVLISEISTAWAGGWSINDAGATRIGMYAVTAKVDDATAIFHNVANIATIGGTELHFSALAGFATAKFKLLLTDPDTGERYYTKTIKPTLNYGAFPFLSAVSDFGLKGWRFGIANYFPNLTGGMLHENGPERYHLIRGYFVTNYTSLVAAKKINEQLYAGLSLDVIYANQTGYRKLNLYDQTGLALFQSFSDVRLYQSLAQTKVGYHLSLLYVPSPTVRVGISYFEETDFSLAGDVTMKTSNNESILGMTKLVTHSTLEMMVPRAIKFGANFKVNERWNWGVDLYWWDYSKFKSQKQTLDDLDKDPIGRIVAGFLGTTIISPKNYQDSYQVCVGAEYKVNEKWKVRGGLQYDDSPIPNETFSIDALTSDAFNVACGFSYQASERTQLGFGYQHITFTNRDITNSVTNPPTNGKIIEAFTDSVMFEYYYRF